MKYRQSFIRTLKSTAYVSLVATAFAAIIYSSKPDSTRTINYPEINKKPSFQAVLQEYPNRTELTLLFQTGMARPPSITAIDRDKDGKFDGIMGRYSHESQKQVDVYDFMCLKTLNQIIEDFKERKPDNNFHYTGTHNHHEKDRHDELKAHLSKNPLILTLSVSGNSMNRRKEFSILAEDENKDGFFDNLQFTNRRTKTNLELDDLVCASYLTNRYVK